MGVELGAAGEVGMSSAFCAPSCGDPCSLWSPWSGCANSTCLSQLQLFLPTGKFESALGMEFSATKRIEGLGNVFEILQEEKKNPTFYFSTVVLEHVLSDKSSSLLQDAI